MIKKSPRKKSHAKSRLVLASASPRRAELLREAGYTFTVTTSPVREPALRPRDVPIEVWPCVLAHIKAAAVQKQLRDPRALIIGADTIVVLHGRVMNKARNRTHARHMLSRLFGHRHQVITGLALLQGDRVRLVRSVSTCFVRKPSASWLETYLDSTLWKGKAGAYGIQDGDTLVQLVSGEFTNVMGLPMELLSREIRSFVNQRFVK